MDDLMKKLGDQAPSIVKNNKGALIGALIGYFLSDNEKAKSAILGAVAGSLLADKKKDQGNE